MNRLQRKCVVASAGFHLLLVMALLIGSAFRPPNGQRGEPSPIQLVPAPTDLESVGPVASPTVTQASLGTANPRAETRPRAEAPAAPEADHAPRLKLPRASLVLVERETAAHTSAKPTRPTDSHVAAIDGALKVLGRTLSPLTTIDSGSVAGGSEAAQDYAQSVKSAYEQSWDPSGSEVANGGAVTTVTVTIARDGKVLSARILQASDNAMVTESVRRALQVVQRIRPFEPGAKAEQRTYTIHFDVRTKRFGAE